MSIKELKKKLMKNRTFRKEYNYYSNFIEEAREAGFTDEQINFLEKWLLID